MLVGGERRHIFDWCFGSQVPIEKFTHAAMIFITRDVQRLIMFRVGDDPEFFLSARL